MRKSKDKEIEELKKALNRQSNINIIIMTALIILVLSLTSFIIDDKFLSDSSICDSNIVVPIVEPTFLPQVLSNKDAKSKGKELYLYAYNTLKLLYDVEVSNDYSEYISNDKCKFGKGCLPITNWSTISRKFTNDFINSLDYTTRSSNHDFGIVTIDSIAYGIDGWIGNELDRIISIDIISKNETEIRFMVKAVIFDSKGNCEEDTELCKCESSSELVIKLVGNTWKIDSFTVEVGTSL